MGNITESIIYMVGWNCNILMQQYIVYIVAFEIFQLQPTIQHSECYNCPGANYYCAIRTLLAYLILTLSDEKKDPKRTTVSGT